MRTYQELAVSTRKERRIFSGPMMFDKFERELIAHGEGGYHYRYGPVRPSEVHEWLQRHSLFSPPDYLNFLCRVGPGRFFDGSLTIYPLSSRFSRSVESELLRLGETTTEPLLPFGYDGTTESCYCVEARSGRDTVYWFSWEEKIKRSFGMNFREWIDAKPAELFNEQIYCGYKELTNVGALIGVMEERSAFRVRLVGFDKELKRPPDKPNDLLPRYNEVALEVTKTRPVTIPVLTVIVERLGSQVGKANLEYATFPVQDIPVNKPTIRECFVFDPFNLPFSGIVVKFNPAIDLRSKMRVRFKEISGLLGAKSD